MNRAEKQPLSLALSPLLRRGEWEPAIHLVRVATSLKGGVNERA